MCGGITDLPRLRSFEQALEHYGSIKPIRGSNTLRPICATPNGRRKKHMQIIKRDNATVVCRLYDTDVLTFRMGKSWEDGVVEFNSGGFISNTTHSFASSILYPYVGFWTKKGSTEIAINWQHHEDHAKSYHVGPKQTFKMRRTGEPHQPPEYTAIEPPKNFEYYLKRKEYNAHRKPLKEFQEHCIRMTKLADPREKQSGRMKVWETFGNSPNERGWFHRTLYNDLTTKGTDMWGDLVPVMLERARSTHIQYENGHYNYIHFFDKQKISESISEMVKYAFADELFEERETTKRTFNGNEKYIWDKYKGGRE